MKWLIGGAVFVAGVVWMAAADAPTWATALLIAVMGHNYMESADD